MACNPTRYNNHTPSAREDTLHVPAVEVAHSEIGRNIDRYLSAMESIGFSGAIIVSEGDSVILRKGYGMANRETRRPYTPTTVQSHGSITKQMTAAAILLLESRGQLSVEDSIASFFDKLPEEKKDITIHQLLTQSSGLAGGIGSDEEPINAHNYVDQLMEAPMQFEPGTNYAYSNAGYALLGIIVEQVSGRDYEEFLRNELLLPAGLTETGYLLPNWDQDRLAVGYRNGHKWGLVYKRGWLGDGPGWHLRANGGIHTTVDDMYLWFRNVLKKHTVLSDETVRRWTTGYVTEGNGVSRYGYGWVYYGDSEWGPMIAHSGSNNIFAADFVWLPEKELFFYIQGNTSMVPAYGLRSSLLDAAFNTDFIMPPLVTPYEHAQPEIAQQREVTYYFDGGSLELTSDDTRLFARLTGQPVIDLMLNHTESQKTRFAELNQRTREAMDKLEAGEENALAGMIREEEDPIAPTKEFLTRIEQIGDLEALHVIGTFANAPGSGFGDYGPWTTFVYAEFATWNQYWNLIWDSEGFYQSNRSGPWPTFILVPVGEDEYTGIRQRLPWETVKINFKDGCLVVGDNRGCIES